MKVIFLDIDGVLQPGSYQDRFEHLAEVSDLAKKLNVELNNGFDYYKLVGDDMYIGVCLDDHFVWSDKGWIRQEHADKMIEILNKEDGPYPLPAELKTKELEEWREKRVYHSEYYH